MIRLLRRRHPGAVEALVRDHYDRVYRLAYVMCGNVEDALDLTQDTFAAALEGLPRFRGESAPMGWLAGILRNRFMMLLRRRRRPPPLPPPATATPDLEPVLGEIRSLPEPQRTTLYLFYTEELDYAAIARAMDCPVGTVRSRLHQARATLRKKLEHCHEL